MPIGQYYGGHGERVLRDMKRRYGNEQGERNFYATANKRHQTPARPARSHAAMKGLHKAIRGR